MKRVATAVYMGMALLTLLPALIVYSLAWWHVKGTWFELSMGMDNLGWAAFFFVLWMASLKGLDILAGR